MSDLKYKSYDELLELEKIENKMISYFTRKLSGRNERLKWIRIYKNRIKPKDNMDTVCVLSEN